MEPHVTGSEGTQVTPYLLGRCRPSPHIEGSAGPSSRAVGTGTTWDLGTLKASCLVQVSGVNQPLEADCISHGSLEKQNLSSVCMCVCVYIYMGSSRMVYNLGPANPTAAASIRRSKNLVSVHFTRLSVSFGLQYTPES